MEYEIRILEINCNEWIQYLERHGAEKIGSWLQRRKIYDFHPVNPNKWIRLRTNGIETTLTIKEILDKEKIDGTREVEIVVSDFDKAGEILEELGYGYRAYQENKRIRYMYQGVEFDIDTWPLIPSYVEIEGKTKEDVEKVLNELPMDLSQSTTHDIRTIYQSYGIHEQDYRVLTFEEQTLCEF